MVVASGSSVVSVRGLLIALVSLIVKHRLQEGGFQ